MESIFSTGTFFSPNFLLIDYKTLITSLAALIIYQSLLTVDSVSYKNYNLVRYWHNNGKNVMRIASYFVLEFKAIFSVKTLVWHWKWSEESLAE